MLKGFLVAALLAMIDAKGAALFRDFMGVNGHTVQFKPELYRPLGMLVRDYHPVEWDLGKDSDFVTEFPFARNRVNWETVYGSWKKAGWRVDVCLMFESLSREKWKDVARDARTYGERFARAFGPSSKLALVESVEIGNEPGKWSDADYRRMFENMARGLRDGDPRIRIVTCALTAGKSHDYAKSVECIKGLEGLYDVLNVHTYAELEGWPTWRRSFPEDPKLKRFLPDVLELCNWRDANASGKEVWITEFGYDATTKTPDPKTEFKNWVGVTEEQQAVWTARSWLLFATLPVDRAYVYFFNDSDQPQVHGSSGLTRNFVPKPAFYAATHLQKNLANYRFEKQMKIGDALISEFGHERDERKIWIAWLPVGDDRRGKVSLMGAQKRVVRAERLSLREGENVAVEVKGRDLEISGRPMFLFFE